MSDPAPMTSPADIAALIERLKRPPVYDGQRLINVDEVAAILGDYAASATALAALLAEIETLRAQMHGMQDGSLVRDQATQIEWQRREIANMEAAAESALAARDELGEAMIQIVQWADAYPIKVFPEPDFKAVREALEAKGITLDAVSASNMRHVIDGVGRIARAAIEQSKEDGA